jgi:aspartyl-tRNA(Asn)/glutamyl-tRNA(Gln) amidotransferase subunit A
MPPPLHVLSLFDLVRALRDRRVTARCVTDAVLERAEALNPTLRAFVELWPEQARARADAMDLAPGSASALCGAPLAHKDIFARPGRQPGCGVPGAAAELSLPASPVLARLGKAGSVELGVANLAEFALGVTGTNTFFSNACNPWNPPHCAGGSSSGSAVAVATGLAWGSLGTDTGASCRVPASFCGVVGLKPTHAALSTEGAFPLSWSLDTVGILARSVEDCAFLFALCRTPGPGTSAAAPTVIGIPRSFYDTHTIPAVARAWEQARTVVEQAGYRLQDVAVIETEEIRSLTRLVMRSEAAALHRAAIASHPERYPLAVRNFITAGEGVLATDYIDALRLRAVLLRRALADTFGEADLILVPTVPVLPPRYDAIANAADPAAWRSVALLAQHTQPASYLGLPALSVPFTLSQDGLPIGMQVIGRPWAEEALFAAARPLQAHWQSLGATPPVAA